MQRSDRYANKPVKYSVHEQIRKSNLRHDSNILYIETEILLEPRSILAADVVQKSFWFLTGNHLHRNCAVRTPESNYNDQWQLVQNIARNRANLLRKGYPLQWNFVRRQVKLASRDANYPWFRHQQQRKLNHLTWLEHTVYRNTLDINRTNVNSRCCKGGHTHSTTPGGPRILAFKVGPSFLVKTVCFQLQWDMEVMLYGFLNRSELNQSWKRP